MSRVFFSEELEGVATFWQIMRRDGVTLGFTSHNRDLYFGGLLHRAAPGMLPSAIRRSASLSPDSAEVQGVLSHSAIGSRELSEGRFDSAQIKIGAVNWETMERAVLYNGSLGSVTEEAGSFTAELQSAKSVLEQDLVPRTSPTCRAQFCGVGCSLSAARFTAESIVIEIDLEANAVLFEALDHTQFLDGQLRWTSGPQSGTKMQIVDIQQQGLVLEQPISPEIGAGERALLIQGCDHTIATCTNRFANSINFQGEPFLPGNDLLARYPLPQ